MEIPFLTAEWRNLVVLNYEIAPELLLPFVPLGTELDLFDGKALVSVIAFDFRHTKLFGLLPTFPASRFNELNLRFYVRRREGSDVRRGVVFIKEVVPSRLIATAARLLYGERYECLPLRGSFDSFSQEHGGRLDYTITTGNSEAHIRIDTCGDLQQLRDETVQSFILEHYWGYTALGDSSTSEYRVKHRPWLYWDVSSSEVLGDLPAIYPKQFRAALQKAPHSVFVAQGSPVSVYAYKRFRPVFDTSKAPPIDNQGWLLFDGRCGFCSWWVSKLERLLARAGFTPVPLQAPWVSGTITIPPEDLINDIRILLKNGLLISGFEAYLCCMQRIRGLRVLGILLGLPGIRLLARGVYRLVNRSRFRISRICKLPPTIQDRN